MQQSRDVAILFYVVTLYQGSVAGIATEDSSVVTLCFLQQMVTHTSVN